MATLTDFITNWGEVVELDFPKMDLNRVKDICDKHPGWKEYQGHKKAKQSSWIKCYEFRLEI